MCTDFIDLYRGCPKDHYSLPFIDRLVDAIIGYVVCSLVDVIYSYHQIMMCELNAVKIIFITDEGVFYYKVISFDLKNTRATY